MEILTRPQKFGLRFVSLLILVSIATWAINLPTRLTALQKALAQSAAWIANATGSGNRVLGDKIFVPGMTIDINYECTGAYVLLLLGTFLVAYPARWSQRLAGLVIGVSALTILNAFRIAVLIRIAEIRPDLFLYFHEYVWQGIFLVLVIVYAMHWVEKVQ